MLDVALKQRLFTAAILIPLLVWLVMGGSTALVALALAGVVLLGAKEWAALFNWHGSDRSGFMVLVAVMLGLTYALASVGDPLVWFWVLAVGGWCAVGTWLWLHRQGAVENYTTARLGHVLPVVMGIWVLVPGYSALVSLHSVALFSPGLMLFCLTLMWAADTAAYFVGRRFGRRKLAPAISPGKTWEGALGACVATVPWAVIGYFVLDRPTGSLFWFVALCMVTAVFSIFGDLLESQMKRLSHVKDSGQLLPGHGGVLDRIDSTTAGAPMFVLGLWLLS